MTIPEVDGSFHVPVNEFDGRITYGEHKRRKGLTNEGHVAQLAPSVTRLADMERLAQTNFINMQSGAARKWTL